MSRRKVDPVPQRQLALRLRYHIDCIRSGNNEDYNRAEVESLVKENPTSLLSRHVAHNVGEERLAWMRKAGYLS